MKYIFFFTLLVAIHASGQETPSTFWKNKCDYKTDGTGKSLGLKIKLSIPCAWKQADGDRPHVVKKFTYAAGGSSAVTTFTINKLPAVPSKAEVKELFTQAGLQDLSQGLGTFLGGRKVMIDGLECGEITLKMTRSYPAGTVYLYSLFYYFVYQDKTMALNYMAGSTTEEKAKALFESYKPLFRSLAGQTVFLSQWE